MICGGASSPPRARPLTTPGLASLGAVPEAAARFDAPLSGALSDAVLAAAAFFREPPVPDDFLEDRAMSHLFEMPMKEWRQPDPTPPLLPQGHYPARARFT